MTTLPRISIVTPVYNRVGMIEQTIQSVLNQQYPNLEYIIIDGGSTDGTVGVIQRYAEHLTYWVSEPDKGMYDAIQKGFQHATGDILAWVNSDDLYHQGALKIVGEIFAQLAEVEWIVGRPTIYNEAGLCVKVQKVNYWSHAKFQSGDYRWIQQESCFWRKGLWERVGGLDLNYRLAADFDLWCRMIKVTPLYSLTTILGGFRQHGNQLSFTQAQQYEQEVAQIVNREGYRSTPHSRLWRMVFNKRMHKHKVVYSFAKKQWERY